MKFINKKLLLIAIFVLVVFTPIFSFGQAVQPINNTTTITNPISPNNINDFIKIILQGVIKIGIPVVALAIIYSGFLFVAAQGNSEKLKTAKKALLYSLVGAAILLGSWAIAQVISNTVLAL